MTIRHNVGNLPARCGVLGYAAKRGRPLQGRKSMVVKTRMLSLVALLLLIALAPGLAQAGGWTLVVLDQTPQDVRAGQEFQVGFMVLQHGTEPIGGLEPKIDLTETGSGQKLSFTASPQGELGHYIADLTLPSAGTWEWAIETFGPPATLSPILVAEAAPVPSADRIPVALPQRWVAFIIALALAATAGLVVYRRRLGTAKPI